MVEGLTMAHFVYIKQINEKSWLHWSPKAQSSCLRDFRKNPIRNRSTAEIEALLELKGNYREQAPPVPYGNVEFWIGEIKLRNIASGFEEPKAKKRLQDGFKMEVKKLITDSKKTDLRAVLHRWVSDLRKAQNKQDFNHWDNHDASPKFGLDKGIGWMTPKVRR